MLVLGVFHVDTEVARLKLAAICHLFAVYALGQDISEIFDKKRMVLIFTIAIKLFVDSFFDKFPFHAPFAAG